MKLAGLITEQFPELLLLSRRWSDLQLGPLLVRVSHLYLPDNEDLLHVLKCAQTLGNRREMETIAIDGYSFGSEMNLGFSPSITEAIAHIFDRRHQAEPDLEKWSQSIPIGLLPVMNYSLEIGFFSQKNLHIH